MSVYTGKNLEDVLKQAAQDKEVEIDQIEYTVLEENKGFLGIGASITIEVRTEEDIESFISQYFDNFFDNIQMEVDVDVELVDNRYRVELNAENNAIIIGRGGQSLQGLNTLIRSVASAQFKKRVRVSVDINNYKQDRYSKLSNMARRVARNVSRSQVDASLDPMPSDERRIVHQALANYRGVVTESIGEGQDRHIVIRHED